MSKRQKLLEKLRNNPKGVTIHEVRTLLENHDYSLKRITGSHYVFNSGSSLLLVIPVHNNKVSPTYVRMAVEAAEQAKEESPQEEDEDSND
jgi:predicted RNA binding protein YcfA (HicA-like mRNA interferase family)